MTYVKSIACYALLHASTDDSYTYCYATTTIRDVPTNSNNYKAISWAVDNDLMSLNSASNFYQMIK